jgi:hypothetical protein
MAHACVDHACSHRMASTSSICSVVSGRPSLYLKLSVRRRDFSHAYVVSWALYHVARNLESVDNPLPYSAAGQEATYALALACYCVSAACVILASLTLAHTALSWWFSCCRRASRA